MAGVSQFGILALGNTSAQQTQCDVANLACIKILSSSNGNPGQITDTQMKCGSLGSIPPNYYGVWLGRSTNNVTVSGTAAPSRCGVPGTQLVYLDGPPDPTITLCNNSNAAIVICGGVTGLPPGRFYTQPTLSYTPMTLAGASGPSATTLYAVPYVNPTGGVISQMGIAVTTAVGGHCELGVYASTGGAPGALLLDAGQVPTSATGMITRASSSLFLQPNTLYFLVVGCTGNAQIEGTAFANGLTGLFYGQDHIDVAPNENIVNTTWVYSTNNLPKIFGTPTYLPSTTSGAPTVVPNVYVGS